MDIKDLRFELEKCPAFEGSIGIISHISPDGDGFCASLALQYWLQAKGRESHIVTDGDDLDRFRHLIHDSQVHNYQDDMQYDLVFVLDCNSYDRLGERGELVRKARQSILIDHHIAENHFIITDVSHIDTSAASVGTIIFEVLKDSILHVGMPWRGMILDCLYTTILNDTNNFTNANTDARVLHQAAEITAMGAAPHILYKEFFMNHTPAEMKFVGEVLATIETHFSDRVLFIHSTLEMTQRVQIDPEAFMSVTRYVQGISGLYAIAYFREEEPGKYKVSLRSLKINVNQIAVKYGGGGHKNASGCHMYGSLAEVKATLTDIFGIELEKLG